MWSPTALGATLTPAAGDEASGEAAGQFLQLDVGSVMDLDDLAVLDELATEFLTSTQMQMPQPGFPSPAAAAPAAPPTINIPGLPPMPAVFPRGGGPPQVAPSVLAPSAFLPPAAARGAFGFIPPALRAAAPQVAAPQQHPFRFPGGLGGFGQPQPMVQSPLGDQLSTGSSSDQSTMVLDEALNLLAYDQSQVRGQAGGRAGGRADGRGVGGWVGGQVGGWEGFRWEGVCQPNAGRAGCLSCPPLVSLCICRLCWVWVCSHQRPAQVHPSALAAH